MPTTAAATPHWGIAGLPFMNSRTRPRALVTTPVSASVLALSGYAALKVRRANLEADLGREAFEIATALRAGIEPVAVSGDALSTMLHGRIRAAREPDELFQLEVLRGGTD